MTDMKCDHIEFPHYWICHACASERGGVMSPGVCTMSKETCKYCQGKNQTQKFIAPWVDFDWPKNKDLDRKAKVSRD